jgi:hypothetical protein
LVKTILYCSFSIVVRVSAWAETLGETARSGAEEAVPGWSHRLRLVWLLALGLRGGRRRRWLLLCSEVIETEDDNEHQEHDNHHAAHVATAAAAVATWALKIGIANFCQWILPIR